MQHHEVTMRRIVRSTLGVLALAALALGAIGVSTAAADTVITFPGQHCPDPSGTATAKATQELMPGVKIGPALVTTPGKPNRNLTADQATAFIQSWLPASVYTQIAPDSPPAGVPVSKLEMNTAYAGALTCIVAWYAVQGDNVWVGMPAQGLGFAVVQKDRWIPAPLPELTRQAFAGHGKPQRGFATPSTTTTVPDDAKAAGESGGDDSSSTWLWILIPGVVIVGGAGIWLLARGRSRAQTD